MVAWKILTARQTLKHALSAAGAQHKGIIINASAEEIWLYLLRGMIAFYVRSKTELVWSLGFCNVNSLPLTLLHLTDVIFLISFCIYSLLDQKICQLSVLLVALQVKGHFNLEMLEYLMKLIINCTSIHAHFLLYWYGNDISRHF